jgi:hypothetical protein
MRRDPVFRNRMIGTMNLTAVGMLGQKVVGHYPLLFGT